MKRLLLWTTNVLFLMVLSASYAGPRNAGLTALAVSELNTVTAGACTTCGPQYPYIEHEGWDMIKRQESAHTVVNRSVVRQLINNSPNATAEHKISYNNACSYRWTSGSASIGASLGISFNRTYQCDQTEVLTVLLPPRTSATLYQGTKRYYVTETYRHYMQWSDGYRELSGQTASFRREHTYSFREVR
jgi:hypothetical protein